MSNNSNVRKIRFHLDSLISRETFLKIKEYISTVMHILVKQYYISAATCAMHLYILYRIIRVE